MSPSYIFRNAVVILWSLCGLAKPAAAAIQTDFTYPGGGDVPFFGHHVTVLPNGNLVVVAAQFTEPGGPLAAGAVFLFTPGGRMISQLKGSYAFDAIGNGGVKILANGNYVIMSPFWNSNGADKGAVTWGDKDTGVSGTISPSNSLLGTGGGLNDQTYGTQVVALANGNYVVVSPDANVGGWERAGAVTWGSGDTGVSGIISTTISLTGSSVGEGVGSGGVYPLTNGNYVTCTWNSFNASGKRTGAVTWGNGTTGITGVVSSSNSLMGTKDGEMVGAYNWTPGVYALSNGNYVVRTPNWGPNYEGAVTWANGETGLIGTVSAANSMTGRQAESFVGDVGVTPLKNGNYVISSARVDHGAILNAGAVTWCQGSSPSVGTVSADNSLVGTYNNDNVGSGAAGANGVFALANGHYVVGSVSVQTDAGVSCGAVTWGNGTTGTTGEVSAANSLLGKVGDLISLGGITALTNGNYVVCSPYWYSNGIYGCGAATWCDGSGPVTGSVNAANSLVGTHLAQYVGAKAIALANGNYVVCSPQWESPGGPEDQGAASWGNGSSGTVGIVGPENSLVGSSASDKVGETVVPLSNGNYVAVASFWDRGVVTDAGAVTWGNGTTGTSGVVSAANSLVGATANDRIGSTRYLSGTYVPKVFPTSDGHYLVGSQYFQSAAPYPGAVTLGNGINGTSGEIDASNSVIGDLTTLSLAQAMAYDPDRRQLAVGQRMANKVALFSYGVPEGSSIVLQETGTPAVYFKGTARQTYLLQRSSDMTNWNWQREVDASGAGAVFFQDEDPPTGRAFYRLIDP
ncbi:hypothetical protein [Luteolibacter luteus]|uniref:Uncharacterized protein n=1 Tax=Luteolibacter luteus TaxID=2728835 RepID=A0A858RRA1_9BACT|nr:hypothetical protein [Luteolibacter luteus]QJE98928.1 hypothetical protein HHL09_25165 [Luteolibacter luteus]